MLSRLAAPMAMTSGASSPGAPAWSAPRAAEKSSWRIGAAARGSKRAIVVARQIGQPLHEQQELDFPASASPPEALLLALADGVHQLRERGAGAVTIVVVDGALVGYLRRGWRPRSLAMHRALERLVAAGRGMCVDFEVMEQKKDGGAMPWTARC